MQLRMSPGGRMLNSLRSRTGEPRRCSEQSQLEGRVPAIFVAVQRVGIFYIRQVRLGMGRCSDAKRNCGDAVHRRNQDTTLTYRDLSFIPPRINVPMYISLVNGYYMYCLTILIESVFDIHQIKIQG